MLFVVKFFEKSDYFRPALSCLGKPHSDMTQLLFEKVEKIETEEEKVTIFIGILLRPRDFGFLDSDKELEVQ